MPILLIADPNLRNRNVLRGFSDELHYTVAEASSGAETLHIAKEKNPDLILLDSKIPGPEANEVIRILKNQKETKMIPILLMTTLDEKDRRFLAVESGADDMLVKPLDKLELMVRVKSLVRIKFYHDELLQEREKVEKMKEDLLAMTTHDLKTPLTVILGNLGTISRRLEKQHLNVAEFLAVDQSARNLLLLVNNLLSAMRLDSEMLTIANQDFQFDHLAEEVGAIIRPLAEQKNITFIFEVEKKCWVYADCEKIRQVLSNLLSNAVKFTPPGGKVTLRCSDDDSRVHVEVTDSGCGIPSKQIPNLYKKFGARDEKYGGTGLGLYIVKKMLGLHGIEINMQSQVSQGTTFAFDLPKGKSGRSGGTGRRAGLKNP